MNQYTGTYRHYELLFIRNELERFGLRPLEGEILNFLCRSSCAQEGVYAHFDMDKGRIARNLPELEEKGLICRAINEESKQQKPVSLAAKSERVLAETDKIFMRWDAVCYFDFAEERRSLHQDFVRHIAENAMKYRRRQGGYTSDQ